MRVRDDFRTRVARLGIKRGFLVECLRFKVQDSGCSMRAPHFVCGGRG